MSTSLLPRLKPTFPISTRPLCTTSELDLKAIRNLIAKQRWSDLKSNHLQNSNPTEFLRRLIASDLDPVLVSNYFAWSRTHIGASHPLDLTCKLLSSLASSNKLQSIKSLLNRIVTESHAKEQHSISAIFHYLSIAGDKTRTGSAVADLLISSCVANSKARMGFEAFRRAGNYDFRLSPATCNALLTSLVKENETGKVEHVYREMTKRRIKLDALSFNMVIKGLCKAAKMNKANDVVQDMKAFGVSPNSDTYNAIIAGHCKSKKPGNMYRAEAALKEMIDSKIKPDLLTHNRLIIDGYCRDNNVKAARKVFDEMPTRNSFTYNTMINGLCSSTGEASLDQAHQLKDEMAELGLGPNIGTYNAILIGLVKRKMLSEARELFDSLGNRGLSPNIITHNTLVNAYCKEGKPEEALCHVSTMAEREPTLAILNTCTYNTLIGGFCGTGDFKRAREMYDEMRSRGLKPNLVTYNVLISGLCGKGRARDAKRVLEGLKRTAGIEPSHVSYNTVMEGFSKEGNLGAAMGLRAEMERDGKLRPNVVTYNVLIKGCCVAGRLAEANGLLNEMLEKGLVPNQTTYGIIREEMMDRGFVPDIDGHFRNVYG